MKMFRIPALLAFVTIVSFLFVAAHSAFALDIPGAINGATSTVGGWTGISAALAIVAEFVFRLVPSSTPLSWAWILSNTLQALSGLFMALAKWLDSWLPQITK